ncbi:MAG: hypothetical protein C0490_24915, partial [Marivirga sp.]|nr:hypothetical protein [Marivirga sp.]
MYKVNVACGKTGYLANPLFIALEKNRSVLMAFVMLCVVCFFSPLFAQRQDLKFIHFNTRTGLSKNFVWKTFQDYKGIIWFATENGLNRFDGYTFIAYQHDPMDLNSLSSNSIRAIYEDKQKNLWIG